jgi:hypothetical protein
MTEYEILELTYSIIDSMATVFAVYLTILTGYLVVVYLIGTQLVTHQVFVINSLFIAITGVQTYSVYQYALETEALLKMKEQLSTLTPFQQAMAQPIGSYITVVLMLFGVLAALYFFMNIRRARVA